MSCCPPLIQGVVEKHNAGDPYDERLHVGWDFAKHHLIQQGGTLTGLPQVTIDPVEGSQDGMLTVEGGSAQIAGTQVLVWVRGGTPGQTYVLRCAVDLSDGHKLVEPVSLELFRLAPRTVSTETRTTSTQVAALLGKNYDGCTPLGPFIDAAAVVVDRVAVCAIDKAEPLDGPTLALLETWLGAHFYQQMDQGFSSKSTADASASYQGSTGRYYESTPYGRSALSLDSSGCLAEEQAGLEGAGDGVGKATAGGIWLGTPGRCNA
jgi:hypothetical protein